MGDKLPVILPWTSEEWRRYMNEMLRERRELTAQLLSLNEKITAHEGIGQFIAAGVLKFREDGENDDGEDVL